jgi:hypothetical protein
MIHKSPPSSRKRRRAAATLIEVVAGLFVLGVLVSSVTIARGRIARQWADADRRIAAARALDALASRWFDGESDVIPVPASGNLEGVPGCTWRTSALDDPAARGLGAAVVRVDVLHGRRTILSLELLKHLEPRRQGAPQ